MMKNSALSLYEVQEVFPEKGLLLKDLIRGGQYDVREKAATGHLQNGISLPRDYCKSMARI